MGRQKKIKSVTVHYPSEENKEAFQRRRARALAEVLFQLYPPEEFNELVSSLEKQIMN